MSDKLMDSLNQAIKRIQPPSGKTNSYSPVRQSLKKYKGDLVIFNETTKEFNYY